MTTQQVKKYTYTDPSNNTVYPVQVDSAIRDEDGVKIKANYAKKTEIKNGVLTINTNGGTSLGTFSANQSTNQTITLPNGSVQLLNQSVTFVSDNTYEEFPYRASVTVSGISSSTYAEVTYSEEQATSLNFATFIETATDVIYLYSRTNVGTVTIPTISIGMDYSDITIDATPTSGSGNAVSSGGVYTALGNYVTLGTAQTITATKTHKQPILLQADNSDPYIMITSEYPRFAGKNTSNLASANGMLYQIFGYDSRDKNYIQIDGYRRGESGQTELHHYLKNESGSATDMVMFMTDTGTAWVQVPYRTSGVTNTDVLTKGNISAVKTSTETVQHVTYWRMADTTTWAVAYTNNSDNIQVGWLRYYISGVSSGSWQFIMGSGDYVEELYVPNTGWQSFPLVIPPHTSFTYKAGFFINAWATLYEVKLA